MDSHPIQNNTPSLSSPGGLFKFLSPPSLECGRGKSSLIFSPGPRPWQPQAFCRFMVPNLYCFSCSRLPVTQPLATHPRVMQLLHRRVYSAWPVSVVLQDDLQQRETPPIYFSPSKACIEPSGTTNACQQGKNAQLHSNSTFLCPVTTMCGIFSDRAVPSTSGEYQGLHMM